MSAALLLSPYTPLLYAGQEWNSKTPFLYFTDHSGDLGRAVTEGRRKEFAGFSKFKGAEIPDPQAEETFIRSKLDFAEAEKPGHRETRELYRALLQLRREHPALVDRSRGSYEAKALSADAFALERRGGGKRVLLVVSIKGRMPVADAGRRILHTEEPRFGGSGRFDEGPAAALYEVA